MIKDLQPNERQAGKIGWNRTGELAVAEYPSMIVRKIHLFHVSNFLMEGKKRFDGTERKKGANTL